MHIERYKNKGYVDTVPVIVVPYYAPIIATNPSLPPSPPALHSPWESRQTQPKLLSKQSSGRVKGTRDKFCYGFPTITD
jgi:hypothetical protein